MAPPPEYDKEPKAPDKTGTSISNEDTKLLHNLVTDQHANSEPKSSNATSTTEAENKHVETLDDGQLRALLDEAITYKCPKDREGKSSLFKELLEEVEQDEQACEEAARTLCTRRGTRSRRALPHSNSLQDLVAALAAEQAPRRATRHTPHHANVSARAIHGGSLPSGVDTSSLSEEPARGGYLATVRCVNPPPLAERRVSASDANGPAETEPLNRRSKPMFPMTYTARATLEIGSGSVCSGRAVTTTTPSNQVRTPPTLTPYSQHSPPAHAPPAAADGNQTKLMRALLRAADEGGGGDRNQGKDTPRGPTEDKRLGKRRVRQNIEEEYQNEPEQWVNSVENWYKGLSSYYEPAENRRHGYPIPAIVYKHDMKNDTQLKTSLDIKALPNTVYRNDMTASDVCSPNLKDSNTHLQAKTSDFNRNIVSKEDLLESRRAYSKVHLSNENVDRVVETATCDNLYCDNNLRKKYRKQVGHELKVPNLDSANPKNVRNMSIGSSYAKVEDNPQNPKQNDSNIDENKNNNDPQSKPVPLENNCDSVDNFTACKESNGIRKYSDTVVDLSNNNINIDTSIDKVEIKSPNLDIELCDVTSSRPSEDKDSFSLYVAKQRKLFQALEAPDLNENDEPEKVFTKCADIEISSKEVKLLGDATKKPHEKEKLFGCEEVIEEIRNDDENSAQSCDNNEMVIQLNKNTDDSTTTSNRYILAELPNNAYVFLTLPKHLLTSLRGKDEKSSVRVLEENNNNVQRNVTVPKTGKKKKEKTQLGPSTNIAKKTDTLNKNALKVLLFENLLKSSRSEKSVNPGPSVADEEVDSAISFSCITTPEVVATCNTTSSTTQAAVVVDPKPLQLGSGYRAVASVTGAEPRPPSADAADPPAPSHGPSTPLPSRAQPRSVISSTFNGLPLSRPNYGATPSTGDDYKKSLDENGNSVQGFSSPLSGSSQHKKPRRKKSTKNETVIDCQQIDGYQGDKDVNELLRFIESNAEHGRGAKLGRVKHKDDADDKGGKKRSTERRKDKETKMKRATSMEELSRTKIEDLTDGERPGPERERRADAPAKAERRSWGDDARDAQPPSAAELTDFQTVTKKRKPRRRADEPDREPARRARPPSPRARRESAPPSDRSNDSNDDLDSVHSLPDAAKAAPAPAAPAPAPHASYADIARTGHNIPDLIESCNFYAEAGAPRRAPAPPDDYPALERRRREAGAAHPPKGAPAQRRDRKERPAPAEPAAADCPAPDVVADRRPPVVLLDSTARPRDMDGVTFGFDVNEQLLGDAGGRPRCDLLRDAVAEAGPGPGLAVRVGCRALRFVPPGAAPHTAHMLQIVDYVGNAWEDVVRCGTGKVRYFSE